MRARAVTLLAVVAGGGCADHPSKLDPLLAEGMVTARPASPPPAARLVPPPAPPPGPRPEILGTVTVDGTTHAPTLCRPGSGFGTYVEVVLPAGKLRFESAALFYTPDAASVLRGDKLACAQLDRSWGGGVRADRSAYWRGTLAFDCMLGTTPIRGALDLDCGGITPEERAGLDRQRAQMRAEQAERPE